jgi:hypothetical protein
VCVIDPEGDYRSLEALPGVMVLGGEDPLPTPRDLLRAMRYPDRSVVIDLSRCPHDEKLEYIRALLPTLNAMRQRTGLPHRILVDEAHYFLHDEDAHELLDLEHNGYTVVTYCASRLPKALLDVTEVMIVTCESDPAEVEALSRCCAGPGTEDRAQWSMLGRLRAGQAVALPVTEEAGGELRLFSIGPRLTPHVRHREKYVDVPVTDHHAFVFASSGGSVHRARTLRQFAQELGQVPQRALEGFLRRGDFSRWIGEVFGDHALASDLHVLEDRHRRVPRADTILEIVAAIRSRYDVMEDTDDGG